MCLRDKGSHNDVIIAPYGLILKSKFTSCLIFDFVSTFQCSGFLPEYIISYKRASVPRSNADNVATADSSDFPFDSLRESSIKNTLT